MPEIAGKEHKQQVRLSDKRIILDIDRCIGCRSCSAACFYSHNSHRNLSRAVAMNIAAFPYHCRHCDEPVCVDVCPKDAIVKKEDGTVFRNKLLCIGCMSCVIACPFAAIGESTVRRVVSKCDLCISRIEENELPACVATCTSGALQFVTLNEAIEQKKWGARIIAKPGMHRI